MPPSKIKSSKRARKVISMKEKMELINDHCKHNVSVKVLSEKYGLGLRTVYDLLKNKKEILKYCSGSDSIQSLKNRKTLKKSNNPKVDCATYEWLRQQQYKGIQITGEMITEKAKMFHSKLNISSACKYTCGWVEKFKKRHGIRRLKATGEKESGDFESATVFVDDLNEFIQNEQLSTEQIYNADEIGLFWKSLPQSSLANDNEDFLEDYKDSKERITALTCANAAGTHKCKLMLIGEKAHPKALQNVEDLPVIYKSNKKAWLTQELFLEWFHENFVPEVREHLQRSGFEKNCKVLLLLDNCPAHPNVNAMLSENITVKYFPLHCTSLIQPMEQGAIRSFKSHYRKMILEKLVASNSRLEFLKSFNIKSALFTAAISWDALTPQVLRNIWNNLLTQDEENNPISLVEIESDIVTPPEYTNDVISKWLECDADISPFATLSDDDIINMVSGIQVYELDSSSEESDDKNAEIQEESPTLELDEENTEMQKKPPTLAQAIEASSVLLEFLENYNYPGITELDKQQVYRIQMNLLEEQFKTKKQIEYVNCSNNM